MSAKLIVCEPVTDRQRRWLNLLPDDSIDRGGAGGGLLACGTFVSIAGVACLVSSPFLLGVLLLPLGLLLLAVPLFARVLVRRHTVQLDFYSWELFSSRSQPEEASAALRRIHEDDPELAKELSEHYWSLVRVENKAEERRARDELVQLHRAYKDRDRLSARLTGRADLTGKLKQVKDETEELRKILEGG